MELGLVLVVLDRLNRDGGRREIFTDSTRGLDTSEYDFTITKLTINNTTSFSYKHTHVRAINATIGVWCVRTEFVVSAPIKREI